MAISTRQLSSFVLCCSAVLTTLVSSVPLCEDKSKSCSKWAEEKGLCDENPKYKRQRFYVSMSRLCKKMCKMCGDDDESLFDSDSRCNSYFKKGYCDMKPHQGFMLKRCQYSCRSTIRNGIMSPGRGNFQRNNPPVQNMQQMPQQQGYWNQAQAQPQAPAGYGYPQQYGQQQNLQYDQQYSPQYAQNGGQQQYPQQYDQQGYAQTQQPQQHQEQLTAGLQGQQQNQSVQDQPISDIPVQVQTLSSPQTSDPARKHKLTSERKHEDDNNDNNDDEGDADDDTD